MNADRRTVLAMLATLPVSARAQGFAGLGADAEGFALPQLNRALRFPEDHFPHPDYRIEWWYLTANLRGEDGALYGVQWTLFRSALAPVEGEGWTSPQLWMGHAALTTAGRHHHAERFGRGGIGQAGVSRDPWTAFIDDWHLRSVAAAGADPLDALDVRASGRDFAYALNLRAEGPLVPHGIDGYSVKSPEGVASHYYSQPFYRVDGTLRFDGRSVRVEGAAWLDREWSSQPLEETQTGWDWFSLHFDSGEKLMGAGVRDRDGASFTAATWIARDGTPTPYEDGAFVLEPIGHAEVAGRRIPTRWRLQLGARGLDVTTTPLNPGAWMATSFPYWEGPIDFSGTHSGYGYLEMTGYE